MWRKLTIMLFLLVLAQTANTLPSLEIIDKGPLNHVSCSLAEQPSVSVFDNNESEEAFNIPRFNRLSPSLFTAEIQTTPNYVLVIEFFKIKLTEGLFKNLANPPVTPQWFEQLGHNTNSSRLSGWKDGNFLYSSRTTYHS